MAHTAILCAESDAIRYFREAVSWMHQWALAHPKTNVWDVGIHQAPDGWYVRIYYAILEG